MHREDSGWENESCFAILSRSVSDNFYLWTENQHNILLSQELMKGYHKSTGPACCAMKVDLMKAYD